jgi:2-octaprenyl-6-methoxyphenol hydroxylase
MSKADVLIAGGGMVGLTLALGLAQGGLKVIVADPLLPEAVLDKTFDGRVSALGYASIRMFEALGVWSEIEPDAQPIYDILVTDAELGRGSSPFSLHFDHRELGRPMGAIAENRHIRRALYAAVERAKSIALKSGAAVTDLEPDAHAMTAKLADGGSITAPLVVAADGRDSPMRERMGIAIVGWSYPQCGIVTTVEHEKPHNGVAYEHFLPSGPFAILPMTGNRSSLVWTERQDLSPALLKLSEDGFGLEVARRFGAHLGATQAIGPRWSYPLRFHLARAYAKSRFAVAGDAAHGIHPIAGQGLNLGLKDAAALAEVALDAARLGLDIGALDVLKRYERWRRFDSFALGAATDALNRLFSNDIMPLRIARDVGLGLVDGIGPLRRFFMRHAGGDIGKLPRLLRGEAA